MIDESIIREHAYVLWEKDACPEDAAEFYWWLAREQLEAQVGRSEDGRGGDDECIERRQHPTSSSSA